MEGKDIAPVVISILALLVSTVVSLLVWRHQSQSAAENTVATLKQRYAPKSSNIAASVREVAELVDFHKSQDTLHSLWDLLYRRKHSVQRSAESRMTRHELLAHMNNVDSYYDDVCSEAAAGRLPGFFKTNGGWLKRADNYRQLFEPLFIADYYQMVHSASHAGPPASYLSTDASGTYLKRPKRYWYIEQQWQEHQCTGNAGAQLLNTTNWATMFEQQLQLQQQPPPAQQQQGGRRTRPDVNLAGVEPVL
jgi:hypothetical protein